MSLVPQAPAAGREGVAPSKQERIPRSSSSLAGLLSSRGAISSTAGDLGMQSTSLCSFAILMKGPLVTFMKVIMCYVSTEDEEEGGWEKDVGLSEGVDMRAVLWALMSGSTGALLDACMALVGSTLL